MYDQSTFTTLCCPSCVTRAINRVCGVYRVQIPPSKWWKPVSFSGTDFSLPTTALFQMDGLNSVFNYTRNLEQARIWAHEHKSIERFWKKNISRTSLVCLANFNDFTETDLGLGAMRAHISANHRQPTAAIFPIWTWRLVSFISIGRSSGIVKSITDPNRSVVLPA